MTFSNGSTIAYTYDANGRKLRTVHNVGGTTTTTDYAGNVIYENGVQKKLLTEEGYVDISVSTPVYYYYLKDHQGNNRVVVNSGGTVQETNHYYPFGGTFASGTVQPYKYNGKELDTKAGLNWYDYGARHYDAVLGRFTTQDPLAEKSYDWSPYTYCINNPILFIDPNGKREWPINELYKGYGRSHLNNYGEIRGNRIHKGLDINHTGGGDTDKGAPIVATHDGIITRVVRIGLGDKNAGGNRIVITSDDGMISTSYMHLDEIDANIIEGMNIFEGQQIGTMGKSGFGKKEYDGYLSHLHYELRINGEIVNPAINSTSLVDPQKLLSPIDGGLLQEIIVTADKTNVSKVSFIDILNQNLR